MKIKKCPVCKSPVPMGAKGCPMCMTSFSKFQLFKMYWLKKTVLLLIAALVLYNVVVIMLENKKIRTYLENPPESVEVIYQLEEDYEKLNPIQKYFVHKSEIDYLKKNAEMETERDIVEGEIKTVYFHDGSVSGEYTGEVSNDMPNGSGIFEFTDEDGEDCVYEGEFSEGKIEGYGVMQFESGKKFVGYFKSGDLNGLARIYNAEEIVTAKGQFVNDELYGEGVIYDNSGDEIYSGNFKNGIPEKFEYMEACAQDNIVNLNQKQEEYSNKNVCVLGLISEVISENGKIKYRVFDLVSNFSIIVNSREKRANFSVNDKVNVYGYCSVVDEESKPCDIFINAFYIQKAEDIS